MAETFWSGPLKATTAAYLPTVRQVNDGDLEDAHARARAHTH